MQFLVGVLFLLAGLMEGGLTASSPDPSPPLPAPVVDLSHWNSLISGLRPAKADGILAVIHKATQGLTYTDPDYSSRRLLAEREGLLWGAYHFGVGGKSGADQAKHFLRTVGADSAKVLLALDLEENTSGVTMSVSEAEDFVRTVKAKTGRTPVLYGAPVFLSGYSKSSLLKECPLWVAHYTPKPVPGLPQGWSTWALWQYTDGRLGGSPKTTKGIGSSDRNRYNGSLEQLKKKWPNL